MMNKRLKSSCLRVHRILALAFAVSALTGGGKAAFCDELLEKSIAAFRADPVISRYCEEAESNGYRVGNSQAIVTGGLCGVAGCSHTVLVARWVATRGANPQTHSVMALVDVSPTGDISSVKRVCFFPDQTGPDCPAPPWQQLKILEKTSAQQSPVEVRGKTPAPPPVLKPEPVDRTE